MIEAEIKLRIACREEVEAGLVSLGFSRSRLVCEEDCYFDNCAGELRKRDEALRVRRTTDLESGMTRALITYKGRKMDRISMSRKELETGVEKAKVCEEILEALGFHAVMPKVIKIRQEYTLGKMTACLDQVKGLGDFLELEEMAENTDQKAEALEKMGKLLAKLGYSMGDVTINSYLSMLSVFSS